MSPCRISGSSIGPISVLGLFVLYSVTYSDTLDDCYRRIIYNCEIWITVLTNKNPASAKPKIDLVSSIVYCYCTELSFLTLLFY